LIINGVAQLQFADSETVVQPADDRVVLAARSPSASVLTRTEQMAAGLLKLLPETPVTAVGFNMGYQGEPTKEVTDAFECADAGPLSDAGYKIAERGLTRRFQLPGCVLNLRIALGSDGIAHVDLNFHYGAANAAQAADAMGGEYAKNKELGQSLMKAGYGVVVEEAEEQIGHGE